MNLEPVPPTDGQLAMELDAAKSRAARDKAIDQVDRAAYQHWKTSDRGRRVPVTCPTGRLPPSIGGSGPQESTVGTAGEASASSSPDAAGPPPFPRPTHRTLDLRRTT